MNNISAYTAQIMEAKGMHGFTFSSQSYSELPFLPNSIILAAINPFKVAKSYYLVNNLELNISEINEVRDDEINLLDLIPELKGKSKQLNEENEFFNSLSVNWANTLYKMGFEIVDLIKKSASSDYYVDFDSSCMTWAEYQILPIEDIHCFNYDARTTGLLRKICTEYLREDYQFLSKFGYAEHPHYNEGDMPNYLIDAVNNQGFFRDFLKRLFYQIEDEIDM